MAKFNIKKFFKGENIYGFGEGEFSYACSKCVGVKVRKNSKLHKEMKSDLKFADWDEHYTKERIKKTILDIFNAEHEKQEINISHILIDSRNYMRRVIFCRDCPKQINNKYIEVTNNWPDIKCYSTNEETTPIFLIGKDFEIVIMPIRAIFPKEEINRLSTAVNMVKENNKNVI